MKVYILALVLGCAQFSVAQSTSLPKNSSTGLVTFEGDIPLNGLNTDVAWGKIKAACKNYYVTNDINADKDDYTISTTSQTTATAKGDWGRNEDCLINYKVNISITNTECKYRFTSFMVTANGGQYTIERIVGGKGVDNKTQQNFIDAINSKIETDITQLRSALSAQPNQNAAPAAPNISNTSENSAVEVGNKTDNIPDEYLIRHHLIGHQIGKWNIESIKNISRLEVLSKNQTGNNLSFQVKFTASIPSKGKDESEDINVTLLYHLNSCGNWELQTITKL